MKKTSKPQPVIFTVGHSTRTLEEFGQLLKVYGIQRLVDVRTIPRSRHNPQFDRQTLSKFLHNHRINYRHMKSLGGLRRAQADSPNLGWRNASFRGFADYMQTPEFAGSLQELLDLISGERIALMCAEAVPWRCHRSLLADALTVQGVRVEHILSAARRQRHTLTPFARVEGTRITYPAE